MDGKKILGKYPDNLSNDGPEVVTPGIVIPSTPWDAVWNGIGQWFGATRADDLNEAIPNRNSFSDRLFSQGDIYKGTFTDPPTKAPVLATKTPTKAPVLATKTPTKAPIKGPIDPTKAPVVTTKSPIDAPTEAPIFTTKAPVDGDGGPAPSYSCPSTTADPIVIPTGSGPSISRSIAKSAAGTVCVLVRVTPTPRNTAPDFMITRSTNTADYNIIPVARSYDNNSWERVAGPYVSDLQTSGCCSLVIPTNLPGMTNDSSKFKFLLMSFSHSASPKEEVSRFFQHTTFGPTKSMLDSWNYSQEVSTGMKDWVAAQVDEVQTPITSHREFFRKRMNGMAFWPTVKRTNYYGPKFPCDKYSRWRDYTFDRLDWGKTFHLGGGGNGGFLISEFVENQYKPRGWVSEFKWEYTDSDFQSGFFTFCKCSSFLLLRVRVC